MRGRDRRGMVVMSQSSKGASTWCEEWPATGAAVTPGRRYMSIGMLALEGGKMIERVELAYEAWGVLSPSRDNVVLLCHALTGNSHACDQERPNDARAGWWNPLVGPGRVFDTDRFFVLCANVLGGCDGSTGPTSVEPVVNRPYRLRFPTITVGDMVQAQHALLQALNIRKLALVAGGSLGGLQAL